MYDARTGIGQLLRREARPALAGALAAALAFGATELFAGLVTGGPSLIVAVGGSVIDLSPKFARDFAIAVFGVNDKLALLLGIVAIGIGLGAVLGVVGQRRFWVAQLGFVAFGVAAAAAGVADPLLSPLMALVGAALAVVLGLGSLALLLRALSESPPLPARDPRLLEFSRRTFLRLAGVVALAAAGTAAGGRVLIERTRMVTQSIEDVILPPPRDAAAPVPATADLGVEGVGPIVTPNEDFYRIDTALHIPRADLATWRLSIEGLVDRPYQLTYDELLAMPQVERHVTLCCVSNMVGGDLVDNAKWQGVRLTELLDRAGLQPDATQVVGLSIDEFTVGFPVETVYDGRDALVAVAMNGEPLPLEHGFPARLVVAGLYGYVSATKWLDAIILNRLEEFDAYWIPRGWAKEAPIKTQSRIDVPRLGETVQAGRRVIAGVAWAQNRGISKVEVQLDGGHWLPVQLGEAISKDTWRQWMMPWDAVQGRHILRVRATDAAGETQTGEDRPPAPDGATGYHTLIVDVEA